MKETCGLQRDSRRWYLPLNEWFSWRSIWGLLAWRYKALYKVQDRGRQVNLAQEGKLSLWNVSKSCTDAAITLKTYVQASRKDLNDAELEMVTVDLLYDVLIACLFLACILKDFFIYLIVVLLLSHVQLFATPWTVACQDSLSFTVP